MNPKILTDLKHIMMQKEIIIRDLHKMIKECEHPVARELLEAAQRSLIRAQEELKVHIFNGGK